MVRTFTAVLAIVALLCTGLLAAGGGSAAGSSWSPPVGIVSPEFGITQASPESPDPWAAPQQDFYYVDASVTYATDAGNPLGTPSRPRRTIPSSLPAGAVVELHGTYATAHTSPNGIKSNGTAARPVFIRSDGTTRARVTGCWEVSGAYFVIEDLEITGCGSVVILAPTSHGVLRHSDVHGNPDGGGVGVQSWNGQQVSHVVLWDNRIYDNGNVKATYDQDVHGIAVGANVSYLWVVDNVLARNSGDGIQINAGSEAAQASTHHIFVGRNTAFGNKQSGFWVKQAVDVIVSQNQSFDHRPSNSSLGACMGGQYSPEHVWFINNAIGYCDYGIQLASDTNGFGRYQFFIGNVIFKISDSNNDFDPDNAWQNCGISLPGGTHRYVMQNTLYDVDSGVCVPDQKGAIYLFDNIIEKVRPDGFHLVFASPAVAQASYGAQGNLFAPNFRMVIGGSLTDVARQVVAPKGQNQVLSSAGFQDPDAFNFRVTDSSGARGNGLMHGLGVWEYFQDRYGVSLAADVYGTPRSPERSTSGAIE